MKIYIYIFIYIYTIYTNYMHMSHYILYICAPVRLLASMHLRGCFDEAVR
jgi:hypothetical protein